MLVCIGCLGLGNVHDLVALLCAARAFSRLPNQAPLVVRVLAEEVNGWKVESGAAVLALHILLNAVRNVMLVGYNLTTSKMMALDFISLI